MWEKAAGPGKLVGRKLGGQYKTRLRCINSTIQHIYGNHNSDPSMPYTTSNTVVHEDRL